MTVTPLNYLEDDDEEGTQNLTRAAKAVAGIRLLEQRDIENGQILYESAVGQWPTAAGDPVEVLGLGTWDPLQYIEKDFIVVFEKLT